MKRAVQNGFIQPGFSELQCSRVWKVSDDVGEKLFIRFVKKEMDIRKMNAWDRGSRAVLAELNQCAGILSSSASVRMFEQHCCTSD